MQQLATLWSSFDLRRKLILVFSVVLTLAAVLLMARLATSPKMVLLYSGLESGQAGDVVRALEQRGTAYEIRGDAIYVDGANRDELRMTLASEGLPANTTKGYELLDSLSGFGTTSQMFDAAYWRAKEGELARTIVGSRNISSARIHISNAGSSPFSRSFEPTASVTLTTTSGVLPASQVRAMRYMVASAVSGLAPEDVAVIDSDNGLIGIGEDPAATPKGADRETDLRDSVTRLLEARVGRGNVVVELAIETVLESESVVERVFDPNGRVAISTDTEERSSTSRGNDGGSVTVASNLPDGDASGGSESSNADSELRERVNYEVSETQREIIREPGAIRRISVAVLVNAVSSTQDDGTFTTSPRETGELSELRELVESAIGFDADRGDVVTLKSMAFEPVQPQGSLATPSLWSNLQLNAVSLVQLFVLAVVALVLGLFVLRPLISKRNQPIPGTEQTLRVAQTDLPAALPSDPLDGEIDPEDGQFQTAQLQSDLPSPAGDGAADPVERLRALISERQDETVEILRGWLEDREETA